MRDIEERNKENWTNKNKLDNYKEKENISYNRGTGRSTRTVLKHFLKEIKVNVY